MADRGSDANSMQDLLARLRRQIAEEKKHGVLADKPFKKHVAEKYRARSESSCGESTGQKN